MNQFGDFIPYDVENMIWIIFYGPYSMVISYDSYDMRYHISQIIWAILYDSFDGPLKI